MTLVRWRSHLQSRASLSPRQVPYLELLAHRVQGARSGTKTRCGFLLACFPEHKEARDILPSGHLPMVLPPTKPEPAGPFLLGFLGLVAWRQGREAGCLFLEAALGLGSPDPALVPLG